MAVVVDRGDDLGVVGDFDGQTGTPVEGFLEGKHAGASGVERSQFHGVLVGLGAGVDEEEGIILVAAGLAQTVGKLHLQLVDDRVGVEGQLLLLLLHHLHVVRMAVADGDDSMTTVEVEILLPLVVPHMTPFTLDDVDGLQRIYVKQFHNVFSFHFLRRRMPSD